MKRRAVLPALCLSAWGLFAAQQPAVSARQALVIGNGAYRHLPRIEQPLKNIEVVAAALKDLHFETKALSDLDQASMRAAIDGFGRGARRGDTVVFYFSGYGMQVDGDNWLLPVSFNPKDPENVSVQAYLIQRLVRALDNTQAGPRILVIDASRACPELAPRATGEGLANMDISSRTLVCFSTRQNEPTEDLPGRGPGLFTRSLVEALKTPGLRPVEVFEKVQRDVTRQSQEKQSPYFVSQVVDEFFFVPPLPVEPPRPVVVEVKEPLKPGAQKENSRDGLLYVWIPAGTFKMGCVPADTTCAPDEKPQHPVTISKPFWMTRTEVTVSAYKRFVDATGRKMPAPTQTNRRWMYTENPISKVNWEDARKYCEWAGGRLPTEAEWEYAARGGVDDQIYPWGNSWDPQAANSSKTKGKEPFVETTPVRRYRPNRFGLYDMAGNVREWTLDAYNAATYQKAGPAIDPWEESGHDRVVRGGSFGGAEKDLRIAIRDHPDPIKEATNQTGFRCVAGELPGN